MPISVSTFGNEQGIAPSGLLKYFQLTIFIIAGYKIELQIYETYTVSVRS
jgi:hypothetical protein